jgi:hypothetical protein
MKMVPLESPIEEPTSIAGVTIQITQVGRAPSGLTAARVAVWNDRVLAVDVIQPELASHRKRLIKQASQADPEVIGDGSALESTLTEIAERLPLVELPAQSGDEDKDAGPRRSANFPGLVDLVADEHGAPVFLVVDEESPLGVSLVTEFESQEGDDAGVLLIPPDRKALPWMLPRAAMVLAYVQASEPAGELFSDLVQCIERHSSLPSLPSRHDGRGDDGEHGEGEIDGPHAYHILLAAWLFHTYLLEVAQYSAMLAYVGPAERGKSRSGRTATNLSRRGIRTETLREATLFRDAQDRGATIFLDCMDLWAKAEKHGCEDILLNRYEKGAVVERVLYPDRGPFDDTVFYQIFGATILASNEALGRILDTRCVPISMPLAVDGIEYPVPDEATLLPLRERLTAWRARQLISKWQPDPMPKPAPSRLGDVLLPLAQLIAAISPDRLSTFVALAQHLERERRGERALSWEGLLVSVLGELASEVKHGSLPLDDIAQRANDGRPERERLSNRKISGLLRLLGFTLKKGHANKAMLCWDEDKVTRLRVHYRDLGADQTADSELPTESPGQTQSQDAHHANHPIPDPAAQVTEVSVVSVSKGDATPTTSTICRYCGGSCGDLDVSDWCLDAMLGMPS